MTRNNNEAFLNNVAQEIAKILSKGGSINVNFLAGACGIEVVDAARACGELQRSGRFFFCNHHGEMGSHTHTSIDGKVFAR